MALLPRRPLESSHRPLFVVHSLTPRVTLEAMPHDEDEQVVYEEVELSEMTFEEDEGMYYYECPCGDMFEISQVGLDTWQTCELPYHPAANATVAACRNSSTTGRISPAAQAARSSSASCFLRCGPTQHLCAPAQHLCARAALL